jgi:IS30 family transposase
LSLPEREEIARALIEDPAMAWAEVGRRVSRYPATVSREVTGHGGRARYRAATAHRTGEQARGRSRCRVLEIVGPLRDRVAAELRLGRSPVAIWADLVADNVARRVCVESIYAAVYAGALDVKASECLRMRRPRRRVHRPATPTCVQLCPPSRLVPPASVKAASPATGKATTSSAKPTARRSCGSPDA